MQISFSESSGKFMRMSKIHKIISGGQTGVDRAALDVAIEAGLNYGGWCPKGGWAEDYQRPPGLLAIYPQLTETPLAKPEQRTEWNVRDSSATLILLNSEPLEISAGTKLTHELAKRFNKPVLVVTIVNSKSLITVQEWLSTLKENAVLNFAGARESESLGIYLQSKKFILEIVKNSDCLHFE
jgi:Circularly permutated YpsA SLOG family